MARVGLRATAAITVCLASFDASAAMAQSQCPVTIAPVSSRSEALRPTPLDRRVSLHGRDISLREALDRLSATARFRVSYVAELLPLSRPVCLAYDGVAAGEVLEDLLDGAAAEAVVVGSDHIVLAPVRAAIQPAAVVSSEPVAMMRAVGLLDRVVVTGSAAGGSQRSLPVALDVVNGNQLSQRGNGLLSTVLDGNVPGLWLWSQSPLSLLTRFGSIRGASSFGLSYPKIYVDGIEVANSLLVTQLDADGVGRIEVIRGPQGAALYGADAISGVINIVTRQEGTEGGAPRAQVRTGGGTAASDYAAGSVFSQSHSIALRNGSGIRSGRLGATLTTLGAFIPGAFTQQLSANAGVRVVQSRLVLTGTARLFAQDAETPRSPLLDGLTTPAPSMLRRQASVERNAFRPPPDSLMSPPRDSNDRQTVRQYTIGGNATYRPGDRWTYAVVAGLDGYTLRSSALLDGPFPTPTDSALQAARGSALRSTLRVSSVAQVGGSGRATGAVTLAAEHSLVHEETVGDTPFAQYRSQGPDGRPRPVESTRSNGGVIAQASAAIDDAFFVNGGLRLERNSELTGIGNLATLPMLGAAWVTSLPRATTLKLRTAYGKGIRPSQTTIRAGTLMGLTQSTLSAALSPEEQSGVEAGVDVFVGTSVALHVTGFDQLASGLIQPVSVAPAVPSGPGRRERVAYELQNVGEISNRGVEIQGSLSVRSLSLAATATLVSSRVQRLAGGYTGDLRVGDRMLEVPYRTLGASASWTGRRWFTAWSVSRASDWINYDRIALASAFADQTWPTRNFVGESLRDYWRNYEGTTRIGGNFGYNLGRGLTFFVGAENLLNEQSGEPDNITILPGRAITASLRASF